MSDVFAALHDPALQPAIKIIGLPPFLPAPPDPKQPDYPDIGALAEKILGVTFDFRDPAALASAITTAVPLTPDSTSAQQSALVPQVVIGSHASVFHAAQAMNQSTEMLRKLRPFDPTTDQGSINNLIAMIRTNADSLRRYLGRDGRPLMRQVDFALTTLCGYDPKTCDRFDPKTVGGALGRLRDQACIRLDLARTTEQEQMLTAFETVVNLAWMVAESWHRERSSWADGDKYLGAVFPELHREFGAIAARLGELRREIPQSKWATAVLCSAPPVPAEDFWQWIHTSMTTQLPQTIDLIGTAAIPAIEAAMTEFSDVLRDGWLDAQPGYGCDPLPKEFTCAPVREIVQQLLVDIGRVLGIVRKLRRPATHAAQAAYGGPAYGVAPAYVVVPQTVTAPAPAPAPAPIKRSTAPYKRSKSATKGRKKSAAKKKPGRKYPRTAARRARP